MKVLVLSTLNTERGLPMKTPQEMVTAREQVELLNAQWGDALKKNLVSTSCRFRRIDTMPEPIDIESEEIVTAIKQRAKLFVCDNFSTPTPSDYLIVESTMLIGASIALEIKGKTGE
jgi:hypothetical protein